MRQAAEIKNERASSQGSHGPEVSGTIPRFRLDRRQPTSDQIYQHLRNAILTWQVLPNEPISENRISALCGVSRSPVRAALAKLVEDGLIDVFPQRGTFVSPIRLRAVREAQFVRAALELAVVEEASAKWSKQSADELKACLERQAVHVRAGNPAGFYEENELFHFIIAKAAGLEGVWKTIQTVKTLWDRIGHIANRSPEHLQSVIGEHRGIAKALAARNAEEARRAMTKHMNSITSAIERLRPSYPQFFVDEDEAAPFAIKE